MSKILFVLFQGGGTNLKSCWSDTESDFLGKLKKLGSVYMYQDKLYNLLHYNTTYEKSKDYDNDIDFDLSYININIHIKMVYEDLEKKYKNLKNYKIIPIGWSIGGYMALYFSQKYTSNCIHCILLDHSHITENNMKLRLKEFITHIKTLKIRFKKDNNNKISNIKYKKILKLIKAGDNTTDELYYIYFMSVYLRNLYAFKHIKLKFPVPTTSFINYDEKRPLQNSRRKQEIKILKKHNPENFIPIIFINKTHKVFYHKAPSNKIIKTIKSIITPLKK